jgi:hypothetical protein
MAHKANLLKEIENLLTLGPEGLEEEDRFLLECNFDNLLSTMGKHQGYWLLGIQAAREASRICAAARDNPQSRPRKRQRRAKILQCATNYSAYAQHRYTIVEHFPSRKDKSLDERGLSQRFRLQRCFATLCLWRMKTPFW